MTLLQQPVVIFAHARSGSTSLVRSLNLHPDLNIAEEPFHPKYSLWHPDERSYVETIVDNTSLDLALKEIFLKYDGIKVLDYQLAENLYSELLQSNCKVICLRRRNVLKTIVSNLVAVQTSVWHITDRNLDNNKKYEELQPLDFREIENIFNYHAELQSTYRPLILQKPPDLRLCIDYEDLYTDNLVQNRSALRSVFSFLGLLMPETPEIDFYLNPASSRIMNPHIYLKVPNIGEIEERFGSDDSGWLLRD